jgi:hypothetical protein
MSQTQPINVFSKDREILRTLAEQLAPIAALPVQQEKASLWTSLNQLQSIRPMVWITEIPWTELNTTQELTLECQAPWARNLEWHLRTQLYQWHHTRADMILSPYIPCRLAFHSTGFGIVQEGQRLRAPGGAVDAQHFIPQISDLEDLDKIKMPVVTVDLQDTEARYTAMCDVFQGIMPVAKEGVKNYWYTPWDHLIRWYGVQEAMIDLIDRPDLLNAAVARIAQGYMKELDQIVQLNLLSLNNDNTRIGSGAYGYVASLPGENFHPQHVKPHNMWGCSNAQIFSEVSPQMHWEFALKHDLPWLGRWGLNYYGCCEPLHHKLAILRRIPRLRKISMNYRIDVEKAAAQVATDFVFSYKANPAWLAEDTWRPHLVRSELRNVLEKTRGCHVELVLKDISTVRGDARRVWEWAAIAMQLAEEFAR